MKDQVPPLSAAEAHRPKRSARYEVIREKRDGVDPDSETFYGLDTARVAALGYALEGPRGPYIGRVKTKQVWLIDGKRGQSFDLDLLDERVASIFLNAVDLRRAW